MTKRLPLTGEALAIDLVNSRTMERDYLCSTACMREWIALEYDRFPELAQIQITHDGLERACRIREWATQIFDALLEGASPSQKALSGLNTVLATAPAIRQVFWSSGAVTTQFRREGSAGEQLAGVLAEAVAELLTDPSLVTLKRCEADSCRMLFIPAHPRRRWCSSETCGNRARAARYYQKHHHSGAQ